MRAWHLITYTVFSIDLAIKMSQLLPKLLIATGNPGKLKEFREMFSAKSISLVSLDDVGNFVEVEETGNTFAENARLKASGYAKQSGLFTLADDSGLEIDFLDGRPGVVSARYAGEVSFARRMEILLGELGDLTSERTARFACSIALASSAGTILAQESGTCEGTIAFQPRGKNGFGYDPIFIPDGYDLTFGELDDQIKIKLSHRSDAFCKIIPKIRGFIVYRLDLDCFQA